MRNRATAGVTLIEVLIAVTLLSLLSVGILMAMRVGLSALGKANDRLLANRRVAGAQRILEQELEGFVPATAKCSANPEGGGGASVPFFEGQPQAMRLVSTYSLDAAWRGRPQILEFLVIAGEEGKGVRLVVNEIPYTGPVGAGRLCLGGVPTRYLPVVAGPRSFVLADKLAYCRFAYLEPVPPPVLERWRPDWVKPTWPLAVRVEMGPLEPEVSRLPLLSVTAPIHVNRLMDLDYADE
jgi:prepilin-type N-terminal cleavage/methylation domain-containing protein